MAWRETWERHLICVVGMCSKFRMVVLMTDRLTGLAFAPRIFVNVSAIGARAIDSFAYLLRAYHDRGCDVTY